jgi:hypothetical protein
MRSYCFPFKKAAISAASKTTTWSAKSPLAPWWSQATLEQASSMQAFLNLGPVLFANIFFDLNGLVAPR